MSYQNEDFWIEVNLENVCANYAEVKTKAGGNRGVMAVVKADAYGHGLVATGKALESHGCDFLAVSHFGEGRELREQGVTLPILLMTPALPENYEAIVALDLIPAVDHQENLALLSKAAGEREVKFHLKVNTGMNRFGIAPAAVSDFLRTLAAYENLKLGGVFSHLPCALIKDHPQTQEQIRLFDKVVAEMKAVLGDSFDVHLANSAAAISYPEARYDYVRVGTLLYGQFPAPFLNGTLDLKETWRAKARILATRQIGKGDKVGYGADYTAKRPMSLGVIPVGYTDGFGIQPPLNNVSLQRFAKQSGKLLRSFLWKRPNNVVYFEKKPLPVVGRIAMQTTVISLDHTGLKTGDTVDVPLRRTAVAPSVKKIVL